MARAARLLSLLQALRRRSRPVTAATLASELGVSERTIYRDIGELTAQGASIGGAAGVGYLLRPGLFLPPLNLTEDEVEAIVLGLRYVDQRGDDVLRRGAADALAKITAVLPRDAREALTDPIALPGPPTQDYPTTRVSLAEMRAAILGQTKLSIVYEVDDKRTDRTVWPIALGFMDHARVLVAYCELRVAYRTFRTDRILSLASTSTRYPGRRGAHLRAWREGS